MRTTPSIKTKSRPNKRGEKSFLFKKLLHFTGLLTGLFLLTLLGCTKPSKTTSDPSKSKGASTGIQSKKSLSGIKLGYCTPSLNAPFYAALSQSIQKETEALGMTFFSADGQGDIVKQTAAVEDLISKGVNILVVNPLDDKALVPTVNAAVKSGIPVVVVDSYIDPAANYTTSVQANNLGNGELIGEWLVKKMGGKKIKAALISGAQGNKIGKEKRQGLFRGITEQQLRSKSGVELQIVAQGWGNWTNAGGLKAMEDILVAHPDINVLLAENDAMAMGAMKAIQEAGKTDKILIIGFDGQKEACQLVKEGKLGATALNNPTSLGKLAVELAVKCLNEERNIPKVIYTPAAAITKENVNQYYDPKAIF